MRRLLYIILFLSFYSCRLANVDRHRIKGLYNLKNVVVSKIDTVYIYNSYGLPADYKISNSYKITSNTYKAYFCMKRNKRNQTTLPCIYNSVGWYVISRLKSFDRTGYLIFYRVFPNKKIKSYISFDLY